MTGGDDVVIREGEHQLMPYLATRTGDQDSHPAVPIRPATSAAPTTSGSRGTS